MQKIISCTISTLSCVCVAAQPATAPTEFETQLKELLNYAKAGFKNMPPGFKIEGTLSGNIQHTNKGIPFYRSLANNKVSVAKAQEMAMRWSNKIQSALGNDYVKLAKNPTPNSNETSFVNSAYCNFEIIRVTTSVAAGKRNIYLDVFYDQTKKNELLVRNHGTNSGNNIGNRVKKIIIDKLGVDEKEVTDEASFTNDLGADSLDTVELVMEFEKEFNFSIPDQDCECISTVGQAITYLEAHIKN